MLEAWHARRSGTDYGPTRHQTAGFTPPRGTPNQFWAGLLTRLHPPPAPSHAHQKYAAQWHLPDSSGLQQRGAVPEWLHRKYRITGFPFHPTPRLLSGAPKTGAILCPVFANDKESQEKLRKSETPRPCGQRRRERVIFASSHRIFRSFVTRFQQNTTGMTRYTPAIPSDRLLRTIKI